MNHFLNSSVIIPNNDINIIMTAQIQTITPKIVKVYFSFTTLISEIMAIHFIFIKIFPDTLRLSRD